MPNARDPLVIRDVRFLGGMAEAGGWRPGTRLPEVAFAGRSNVGKSTVLNFLTRRKKLARVSHTPGRTREINFFEINGSFVLVDLPGYGYARVAKDRRAAWRPLIESYLKSATALRGLALLLDARREPSEDDLQMLDFLADIELPTLVVVTKMDEIPKLGQAERLQEIVRATGVEPSQVVPVSAHAGEGRDDLARAVAKLVEQP